MNKILSNDEIKKFKEEGAVFLKNKFDVKWIISQVLINHNNYHFNHTSICRLMNVVGTFMLT